MIGATLTAPGAETAIRARPAALADVEGIHRLIGGYAALGLMLPKTLPELYRNVREYVVLPGPEGDVIGCGGLRIYRPETAEVVGLAVAGGWQGLGLGSRLVDHLVGEAAELGIGTVFAMTLDEGFFHRRGFRTVPRDSLPEKTAGDCRGCASREACREIAVLRVLRMGARPRSAGRRLTALTG